MCGENCNKGVSCPLSSYFYGRYSSDVCGLTRCGKKKWGVPYAIQRGRVDREHYGQRGDNM